jgi:geranylgeranyl pyrophosphate synthase
MKTAELANLLSIPELPSYLEQVDHLLVESIDNASLSIKEPALRLINGGGKRLRPFLVIAAAKSQGGEIDETILRACVAIELIHLGTIVHDDIIDDADIRWGVSTINKKEGVSHAITVGDYLLALSAYIATSVSNEVANALAMAAGGARRLCRLHGAHAHAVCPDGLRLEVVQLRGSAYRRTRLQL